MGDLFVHILKWVLYGNFFPINFSFQTLLHLCATCLGTFTHLHFSEIVYSNASSGEFLFRFYDFVHIKFCCTFFLCD